MKTQPLLPRRHPGRALAAFLRTAFRTALGLLSIPAAALGAEPGALPTPSPLIEVFRLFRELPAAPRLLSVPPLEASERLFHQPGDPDSLFSFGEPTPEGQLHVKAAVEVNDVVLRALPPDFRVDPSDTRQRSAGGYFPLDARGRPYQLRLGARLVW